MTNKNEELNVHENPTMDIVEKEKELLQSYSNEPQEEIEEVKDEFNSSVVTEEKTIQPVKETIEEPVVENNIVEEEVVPELIEEETEEDKIDYIDKKYKRTKRIINIVFVIIMVILLAVATDVICVSKFQKGPFFAIPVHKYSDGGTKEYYGLGYKVIKYHQTQGRRDIEIGSWSLKYNANPITAEAVDMALEFYDNPTTAYQKYQKKFVRVISTLNKVDKKNNIIEIGYKDEGGKYSLDITCNIVKDQKNISKFEEGKSITIIGSVSKFELANSKNPNKLTINNCFAEQ